MSDSGPNPATADLRDVIAPLWRRKWLLLVIVVVSTVGTYVASSQGEKRYRSSARVIATNSQVQVIVKGPAAPETDRTTLDQARLLLSQPVTEAVRAELGLKESARALLATVSAVPDAGSSFVTVTAERGSPEEAAAVANAYAEQYQEYRDRQLIRELNAAIRRVRQQLALLPKSESAAQERTGLATTIGQLQAVRAVVPKQSRQTDQAVPSARPVSPRPKRDAVFAVAISLLLGIALAFALDRFDRRIKRVEEIADVYGVPLLSSIPHTGSPRAIADGKAMVPDMLQEPFRGLRANIQLASLDRPLRCLTITSAIPGEGKSTVVRNLALTYREWGLDVIVVEADLRRPTLTASFGLAPTDIGFTSVLTGEVDLDDALLEVEVDTAGLVYLDKVRATSRGTTAQAGERAHSAIDNRLVLLPSGTAPPNPQAVLATDKARQLIDQLNERFDVVLVDTPPLLSVSDAIPFLTQADGVIIVARVGLIDRAAAERLTEAVGRVPHAEILGVVANDLSSEPGSGYKYGYGYGYGTSGANSG